MDEFSRRDALAALGVVGLGSLGSAALGQPSSPLGPRPGQPLPSSPVPTALNTAPLTHKELGWDPNRREFFLPELPYKPDALEPHLDKETVTIHHERHHDGYVKGANAALRKLSDIRDNQGDPSLIKHWSRELAFHLSGHLNHCYFWALMAPPPKGPARAPQAGGELARALNRDFGSVDRFTAHFRLAAQQVEGGGWAWLVLHRETDMLLVMQAEKQQDLATAGVAPLLGIDVWEHAYYLKYKWDRKAWIDAWLNVVNWDRTEEILKKLRS